MSVLSDIATHTRASSATYVDSDGILQTAAINVPRVGHHLWNGTAWVDAGYFHESEARTNLLLNSGTLSTQSVTVTAVPHTLHFTGTGTVTLSGASTAGPLVGTGAGEQNRVSLTFTPTAASLTLTVSGTVADAQLEVGSTPSSYIPTAGSTVTRAADVMTIPSANLPWPEPVVIGPEKVTNGTFDSDTDWTLGPNMSISTGALRFSSATFGESAFQDIGYTAGTAVTITVDVTIDSGIVDIWLGDTVTFDYQMIRATSSGSYTVSRASAGTDGVLYIRSLEAGTNATVDNISVREINPLAVSIQMSGTMTYADEGGFLTVVQLKWFKDVDTSISVDVSTNSSDTGKQRFLQESGGTIDVSQTSGDYYSPGINVPFNVASRHGSTFINGAADGTALTANTTPTALPDLSATDMDIGSTFMGTIDLFRVWKADITDEGIAEASST